VSAEIELIGIDRNTAANAPILRQRRRGRKDYEAEQKRQNR
jgi:hypothetical protein